jgi:hypothetical protein
VLPRRSATLVMGLAVTSLAAMFATSQLLAESVDRPVPRRLQPLVPDLGSMGTIQVEPPSASRGGRPPAGGRSPAGGTPPPGRQRAGQPPQPAGAGSIVVVVQHQPVRTVVQKVVQVIHVPAASPSRPRPPRRRVSDHRISWRRWLRPPHRDLPDDPPRREEEHPPCPDDPASDDDREGHDGHDGHGRRDGRDHDEEWADRQRDPRGAGEPEAAGREPAEQPGEERDQGRDQQADGSEQERDRQDDPGEHES